MNLSDVFFRVLVFPGVLYGVGAAWLILWIERKVTARMQNRIGPPFYQPFFDFIKLLGKNSPPRPGLEGKLLAGLPVLSAAALLGALTLLPVFGGSEGFGGDAVLLVALLEVPTICLVLAGFVSGSLFGEVGAVREAVLSVAYNIPFLAGVLALISAAQSLNLAALADTNLIVRVLAFCAIAVCLPAKLHINPFSLANAEQEIYAGPLTEIGGAQLALWELAHGLEWVALSGLMAALFVPRSGNAFLDLLTFLAGTLIVVLLLTTLSAGTARLKMAPTTQLYWRAGLVLALLAVIAGSWAQFRG